MGLEAGVLVGSPVAVVVVAVVVYSLRIGRAGLVSGLVETFDESFL